MLREKVRIINTTIGVRMCRFAYDDPNVETDLRLALCNAQTSNELHEGDPKG